MSVALFIDKGKDCSDPDNETVDVIPVSFETVWHAVWMKAIRECNISLFTYFRYFSISQMPEVLEELDRIYDWVQVNGGDDTSYVSWRIHDELKPFLIQFYQDHKDEDYWFCLV